MYFQPKFEISSCTALYGRYIPVRRFTGMRTARYLTVPPKIDRRRPIEGESTVGGRLREIGDRRKREEKKKWRRNITSTVAARRSPAPRRRPRVARTVSPPAPTGDFSPARGDRASPNVGRKIEA
ncbi:hypothetical protein BHM03_00022929, partial [Ensete ventricosum]